MSIDIEKLIRLNKLISVHFRKKHIIVLDPKQREECGDNEELKEDIIYDPTEWTLPEKLHTYVENLSEENQLTNEDKILLIFEKLCKDYVYDDNLISYIKKVDDDVFSLPDWYGRDVDQEWEKNREPHNRRICFELSRYLAEALKELLKDNDAFNMCILWNKNLTHYFVGLTCRDYSIALDTDDFFNIKDLTRLKTGLTPKGVTVLEDRKGKFKNALERFNEGKTEDAINKIEEETADFTETQNPNELNEEIVFLKKAMEVLATKYNVDSQGIFEYMKEIIDIRLGSENREKIWKKIEGETNTSTRYIRCLVINMDGQKYLIDGDERVLRPFNEEELNKKRPTFIPYSDLSRGGFDYYDGT